MTHVAACYIYPLKSAMGFAMHSLDITKRGPTNDRLWMVVSDGGKKHGEMLTQRDRGCEKLALVAPRIYDNKISLTGPGMPELPSDDIHLADQTRDFEIWKGTCKGHDAGDAAAQWLSTYLGQPCRLIRIDDSSPRAIDPTYSRTGDEVSFADEFPLLVTSQPSLDKLREHFPPNSDIGMERFRPNIVLAGNLPFEEDIIHEIKIGDVGLELVKPCERCKMTTINQNTGRSPNSEPLATLARVRRGDAGGLKGAFFGQNAIPRTTGRIHVGDTVEIISTRAPHPALANLPLKVDL